MRNRFFTLLLILFSSSIFCQESTVDSINSILKKNIGDSVRFDLLVKKNTALKKLKRLDSVILISNQLINLAKKSNDVALIEKAFRIKTQNYNQLKEFNLAISTIKESITYFDADDTLQLAKAYDLLGRTCFVSSDVSGSVKYFLESSKYYEQLGNPINSYRALGIVYGQLEDLEKAFYYNEKVIEIATAKKDYNSLARAYLSQGFQYKETGKFALSIQSSLKAVSLYKDTLKQPLASRLSLIYGNIAEVYLFYHENNIDSIPIINSNFLGVKNIKEAVLDTTEWYLKESIKITNLGKDNHQVYSSHIRYGDFLFYKKEYKKALKYFNICYSICNGDQTMLLDEVGATSNLYKLYKAIGNNGKALEFYEKNIVLQDSLFNQDKQRELGKEEAKHEFEKQKAIEEEERAKQAALRLANEEKKKAIGKEKARNQLIIIYSICIGILIIGIFSILIYKRLREANHQQKIIESQKLIIEKNRNEMLESIQYSKSIQQRIFPTIEEINNLLPNSFLLFKSKDVVSGDFYWAYKKGNKTYFSVADCTGHGVPGAFMTLISLNIINSIIIEENINSTATLLEHLHYRLKEKLSDSEDGKVKHGLDIAMCAYNHDTKELEFSGLHNPIYIINSENKLKEIKGDNLFLGISDNFKVTSHKVKISSGDSIYLSTDGFPDQKGGDKGKKFYYSRLRNLLVDVNVETSDRKLEILNQKFEDWKGDKEQIDDVCIMGVTF